MLGTVHDIWTLFTLTAWNLYSGEVDGEQWARVQLPVPGPRHLPVARRGQDHQDQAGLQQAHPLLGVVEDHQHWWPVFPGQMSGTWWWVGHCFDYNTSSKLNYKAIQSVYTKNITISRNYCIVEGVDPGGGGRPAVHRNLLGLSCCRGNFQPQTCHSLQTLFRWNTKLGQLQVVQN